MDNKSFLKSSLFVIIIANSANIFAYLFQFVMGRYLSVEDFGVLNAVNSLMALSGAIIGIIPYVITKYIIEFKHNDELISIFMRNAMKVSLSLTLIVSIVVLIFIKQIDDYLKLNDNMPIYILIANTFAFVILSILFGAMRGFLMYTSCAFKEAGNSTFRFLFAFTLVVIFGYGYNGALAASVFSNIFVCLWVYIVMKKRINFCIPSVLKMPKSIGKEILLYTFPVSLTWFAIGIITNIDIVLVKHYVEPLEAGMYSVASVIARIAVFLPGVLLLILFPQVSQNTKDGKSSVKATLIIMVLTLLLSGGFTFLVYLFPEIIISILFGEKYIQASSVLIIITAAMSLVAVVSVMFNFFLAKKIYSFLYFSWAIIFIFGIIIIFHAHNSLNEIITTIFYGILSLVIVNISIVFYHSIKIIRNRSMFH